jgi:hypothetical protein
MADELNKPSRGTGDWDIPVNDNFDTLEAAARAFLPRGTTQTLNVSDVNSDNITNSGQVTTQSLTTGQVVTTLSLGSNQIITGPSNVQIAFDDTNIDQLNTVTADTGNSKIVIDEAGNYNITGGVQLNNTIDVQGTRFFLFMQKNGGTIASRSDVIQFDFQRPPTVTRSTDLAAGDELALGAEAPAAGSSDDYEIASNLTFLQVEQL